MSVALIEPFALTSERKFAALTGWPDCDLVWPMSVAFTVRLPFVSPNKTAIGTFTSPVLTPLLTLVRRRLKVCPLVYAGQIYCDRVGAASAGGGDVPVPAVMLALAKVTASAKLTTI